MQNGDEASLGIILPGPDLLVIILITLEPHSIFWSNFAYFYFYTLSIVCKTETRLHRATVRPVMVSK